MRPENRSPVSQQMWHDKDPSSFIAKTPNKCESLQPFTGHGDFSIWINIFVRDLKTLYNNHKVLILLHVLPFFFNENETCKHGFEHGAYLFRHRGMDERPLSQTIMFPVRPNSIALEYIGIWKRKKYFLLLIYGSVVFDSK